MDDKGYNEYSSEIYPGSSGVISIQPYHNEIFSRVLLPITRVDEITHRPSQIIPLSGIQLLNGIEKVFIHQTIETNNLKSKYSSEISYAVRAIEGHTLYRAVDRSKTWQKICFGSKRSFSMTILDPSRQEAIFIQKRLSAPPCCPVLYQERMEVFSSPSEYLGYIQQEWSPLGVKFCIRNDLDEILYTVNGPEKFCCCGKNYGVFTINDKDTVFIQGNIAQEMNHHLGQLCLTLTFPTFSTSSRKKALLLACAFLLEYKYFDSSKYFNNLCCCY